MQVNISSFRMSLRDAFRIANAFVTPIYFIRTVIEAVFFVTAAFLAMRLTGLEPFVDEFHKEHGMLLFKTVAVYFILYPIFTLIGKYLLAFLKGIFGLSDELSPKNV